MDERSIQVFFSNRKLKCESTNTDVSENALLPIFCNACRGFHQEDNHILALSCGHSYCKSCLSRFSDLQLKNNALSVCCPICLNPLNDANLSFINPKLPALLQEKMLHAFYPDAHLVECPSCHQSFMFEPGKELDKLNYRPEVLDSWRLYRATCTMCMKTFCTNCKTCPFHDEFTCEEQELLNQNIICRFCGNPAKGYERANICERVCWQEECHENLKIACNHMCHCGHPCSGIKGEKEHFGCAECNQNYCVICAELCTVKPSVKMTCGHTAHMECLINFFKAHPVPQRGIINLPRHQMMDCDKLPYHECVSNIASGWIQIDQRIHQKINKIIQKEDTIHKEEHVTNPASDYYNKPVKFGEDNFLFYMCLNCHKIYYGGHKECGQEDDPNADTRCLRCLREYSNSNTCPKHGEAGMVIKCFFCCRPSLFFCFGTTYFCEECHKTPSSPKVIPCNGHCPFSPHKPNGTREIVSYCTICEAEREKNFKNKR